jgi:hypothetical protein
VRHAAAVLALCAVGGSAAAETRVAAAQPKPDRIADEESAEANLESKAPRDGLTFTFALGGGLLLGGDIGIGRGGALSARIGHVATRRSVITFELSLTGALHRRGTEGEVVTDSNAGLYAGALRYAGKSTWVRASGGLTVFTANARSEDQTSHTGLGGLVGGGLDLVRWGYVVLGFEVFGMASVTSDGFKVNTGFCLGLSYY